MNRYLKFALNFSNSRKLGNIFPNVFFLFFISAMLGLTNNILALSKALPSEIHRIQKFGNADFPVVNIEIITTPSTCNQANGTASLSPETLTYRWAHNGQIGFEMSGLLAGDYQVEVIENGATTQTLTVHIDNENGINVYLASSSQPTCGTFDGVVNVGVEYGSGSYSFAWSDGFAANTSTRTQLSAGVYVVTVTDQSSGCTKTANINLPCTSPPTIDVVTSPSTCQQANGSASLSPENLQYQWLSDNFIGTDRNNLASGSYTVVVKQNGSIIDTVNVVIESENNLNLYLAQVNEPTCDNSDGSVTVAAENGSGTYGYAWSVAGATSQNTLTNIGSGNYFVTVTDGLFGCTKTLSFAVTCKTTTSEILPCNPTTTTEEIVLQDCSLKANYCIDINQNDINTYNIELDATVDPLMQPCAYDTSYTYAYFTVPGSGNIGPYNLTSWLVDGRVLSGSFIDINELVVLMNNLDPTGRWTIQQSSMTIVGGAARTNYGDMDIQQLGTNATTMLSLNSVITSTKLGFALEVGEHTLKIVHESGCPNLIKKIEVVCMEPLTGGENPDLASIPKDDVVSISRTESARIRLLDNDVIKGNENVTVELLDHAKHGTAIMHPNGVLVYEPKTYDCDETETLGYNLVNKYGSNSAHVTINIICEDLTVYTGISPNGDGLNDYLEIKGIENYPNSKFMIYNRAGQLVYNCVGFNNEQEKAWQGTYNGTALPAGIYFYVLFDGKGKKYSGYIHLEL